MPERQRVVVPAEAAKLFKERDAKRWEREQADREALLKQPVEHLSIEEQIRKLEADLAPYVQVTPPAETSPDDPPAEVVRRLEALERQAPISGAPPPPLPVGRAEYVNRRVELLNRLRRQQANEAQSQRNAEHLKRCDREIKALERQIADIGAKQSAEKERHCETMAGLNGEHAEAKDRLAELTRPLLPDEKTDDRLRSLELTL